MAKKDYYQYLYNNLYMYGNTVMNKSPEDYIPALEEAFNCKIRYRMVTAVSEFNTTKKTKTKFYVIEKD